MIKIGLTGGIGSGKTTVANMFKNKNIPVFIADVEAKKILNDPSVAQDVANTFNISLTNDGLIDKSKLASIVFKDKAALEKLNSIIHPKVHQSFQKWVKNKDASYIIYEAAIIFEKDRASDFDFTILITAPEEARIQRVVQRDLSSEDEVKSRMKAQWPESKKKKLADFVIENTNLKQTQQQVDKLHAKFLNFSDK
ncbi:dephospho-CoA kinase [Psychroflexus gondwanensis]|jgi:dephospho-CoA kinase|uniref:Dephospho-CoA kinase n=1 Tax=Psychroflexus gondwanensis ACAM 44 TaxID=1189619 RepID=N1WNH1_9FLAO|nr:dephospho-CoA kinase [Psychroflexus gondwanensis]EMY81841.1 dephospho-CoA kinase CoaE [Psychroflexus gondwanensis ACAM 44]TXE19847.1 dephospho-CoA kinase [Psychroflexus gondwanensis]